MTSREKRISHRNVAKFLHATPEELTSYLERVGLRVAKSYTLPEIHEAAATFQAANLIRFDEHAFAVTFAEGVEDE